MVPVLGQDPEWGGPGWVFDPSTGSGQGLTRAPWGQAGLPDGGKENFGGSFPVEEPLSKFGLERWLLAGLGLPRTASLLPLRNPLAGLVGSFCPRRAVRQPRNQPKLV